MGENKKTIQVNKEYLSFGRSTRKKKHSDKKSRKRKEKPKTLQSAGKMRKEFMKKIKDFQKRRSENKNSAVEKKIIKSKDESEFDDEFNKSLGFLQDVMSSNKEKQRKNIEKNRKDNTESLQIMLDMPEELTNKTTPMPTINTITPIETKTTTFDKTNIVSTTAKDHRSTVKIGIAPQPLYSCLKGGKRPTYREMMRTQKRHGSSRKPHIKIQNKPDIAETERSRKLKKLKREKEKAKEKPKRMIKSKRVTKTIKRKLGRMGKTVSVLIKSRETRKKIATERATLNKTSLHEIKKYLRERNMIKTGTKAPNHVLRKMYEQCILSGDVCNKSADVLVHNYLNE